MAQTGEDVNDRYRVGGCG